MSERNRRIHVRGEGEVETVGHSVGVDLSQVPTIRSARWEHTIDGQGHDGTIVEKGDDKNHEGREFELVGEDKDGEANDDTDGDGASVDGVVPHTLEDDTGSSDGVDDGGETGLSQDDIGGTTGSVSCTLDGDTDVGTGQSWGVVGTITSHGAQMSKTLQPLDNLVLVLGEDSSETVGVHDHLVEGAVLAARGGAILEHTSGVHVVTETETTTSLFGDSELITSDHLDLDTEVHSIVDGLLGILTGRVEDGEQTDELETIAFTFVVVVVELLVSDGQSTETTSGVVLDIGFEPVLDLFGLVAAAKLNNDTGHALGDTLELASGLLTVGDLRTLVDGVEWLEVEELDTGAGAGNVTEGLDDTEINGVLVLGTGGVGGQKHDIVGGKWTVGLHGGAIDGELVGGEGTRLVRAEDGDTGQLLDGGDTSDDGLVLRQLLSTDGESDGKNSGHSNGNTTNEEDKDVVETTTVGEAEGSVEDENLCDEEDTNGNQAEGSDLSQDLLQVTSGVIVLANQGGGTAEEGVRASGDNNTLGFTLLASRTTEKMNR